MRIVGGVAIAALAGCSFGIRTDPKGPLARDEQPSCSESWVRPGFDGTVAVAAAVTGALAINAYAGRSGSCGAVDPMYGYPTERSCAAWALAIGGPALIAAGFTAGAIYGGVQASRCEQRNDAYDRTLAASLRPVERSSPEQDRACVAERDALVAQMTDKAEADRLVENMPCEARPQVPTRHRNRQDASAGIGAGILVAPITFVVGGLIWAAQHY